MVIGTVVKVNVHPRNKVHFESLYYEAENGFYEVRINDLLPKSSALIDASCDYCGEIKYGIRYADYTKSTNIIAKYSCENCAHLKREELLTYRINNKLIDFNENRGHWKNREFVLQEVDSYIKENGNIGAVNGTNIKWRKIRRGLKNINLTLEQAAEQLGYNFNDIKLRRVNGHFDNFSILEKEIEDFVQSNKRYPTQDDLKNELGIYGHDYLKHGTLNEIKIRMGYLDEKDLIDNSGCINKSSYELIVANFLLEHNIPYKREEFPFKKFKNAPKYKSDFTFYLEDGKEIQCEIWGGLRNTKGDIFGYNEKMKTKLEHYESYGIELISIYPSLFHQSIKGIKEGLFNIFKPYLNLQYKEIPNNNLYTFKSKNFTDEQLFNAIMTYSDDSDCLPSEYKLRKEKNSPLFVEVLKRFDTYIDFARKFNVLTPHERRIGKTLLSVNI